MTERILLIQLRRIGDVLMTTAATREVRRAFPDAHIAFLTEPPCGEIYRNNPHVNEVILWQNRESPARRLAAALHLRKARYGVVVDFFSNPQSALITRITGAPRRIGLALRGRGWAYTEPVPTEGLPAYAGAVKLAMVAGLGVAGGSPAPELFPTHAERARAVEQLEKAGVKEGDFLALLSPVSRRAYRTWPPENFAQVGDFLVERYGAKVLLQYGPGEKEIADIVRGHMREEPLPDFAPPALMELAAMLERADLFVGNDNGPRHMAIAMATPAVGVFGNDFPELWMPPGVGIHRAVEHDPGCKAACHYPRCGLECIRDVRFSQVAAAVEAVIEEIGKNGGTVQHQTPGEPVQ